MRAELSAADLNGDPDARYFLAELLARAGRSEEALDLIDLAEAEFLAADRVLDAWRTDAGRTDALGNLGRHDEAITAARRLLERLQGVPDIAVAVLAGSHANLGACLEDAGRDLEALDCHDRAIALVAAAGDDVLAALMEINRSNVRNRLGQSRRALVELEAAARVLEQEGLDDDLATVEINAGETACLLGMADVGLEWFARAAGRIDPESNDACTILVESAAALLTLGAVEEAAARSQDALERLAHRPVAWLEGRAWLGLGLARRLLDDPVGAIEAFTAARDRFAEAGNLPGGVQAGLELLALRPPATRHLGGSDGAGSGVGELGFDALDPSQWPVQAALVQLRLAELVEEGPQRRQRLRSALELAEDTGIPHLRYRAQHRLATSLAAAGDLDDAGRLLDDAAATIERLRRRLTNEFVLRAFPSATAEVLDDLVRVRLAQGRVDDAFVAADRARSRAISDLATAGHLAPALDPEVEAFEADLDVLYDQLLGVDGRVGPDERRRIDRRARALEELVARRRFDLGARVPLQTTVAASPPDGATMVLLFQVDRGDIGLFVRHGDDLTFHPRVGRLDRVRDELDALHAAGRRALALSGLSARGGVGGAVGASARGAEARLAALGELLPAEVWRRAAGADCAEIVVIPHGMLHGVPFHALQRDGHILLDHAAVSVAPSLAVRDRCRAAVAPPGAPPVVVGQPAAGLPGVDREVAALQHLLGEGVFLHGDDATIEAVCAAAAGTRCLHLASHGMFRATAPLQSGVRLADGWLTAERAGRLDLRGAVVVLSACDTGRSIVSAGDELLGLQRGFLLAGAASVVMSLWPARDEASVDLMTAFHTARGAGASPANALRIAQLETRERYPHPWWWAPFIVSGAG